MATDGRTQPSTDWGPYWGQWPAVQPNHHPVQSHNSEDTEMVGPRAQTMMETGPHAMMRGDQTTGQ